MAAGDSASRPFVGHKGAAASVVIRQVEAAVHELLGGRHGIVRSDRGGPVAAHVGWQITLGGTAGALGGLGRVGIVAGVGVVICGGGAGAKIIRFLGTDGIIVQRDRVGSLSCPFASAGGGDPAAPSARRESTRMQPNESPSQEKLHDLLKQFSTVMLVTHGAGQEMRARPMAVAGLDADCGMWFFTNRESAKVHEITRDTRANVVCSEGRSVFSQRRGRREPLP